MARLQTQSIHRMRPMLEEAQQTLPKSIDNDVMESMNRRTVPDYLIDVANSRGGEDNTTVVMTEVIGRRGRQRDKRRKRSESSRVVNYS